MIKFKWLMVTAAITTSVNFNLYAEALTSQIANWPCDQAYLPEVPAAVVWAGPSIEGLNHKWQQDDSIEAMVRRLVAEEYDLEKADGDIAEFAENQQPGLKDQNLTLLFAGVISQMNEQRQKALSGIIRYADGQAIRAEQLSEQLDEMIRLQDDASAEAQRRLQVMQNEMEIKQRMFDERESFIQHLCTRPRLFEEKLGVLARTIAYYVD
ncbi:MAG: hypothetical protein P8163_08055 [Candidatus Thiodiazotropha sp.]